ncbi:hypothetical protein BJX99DRAFT_176831 [Aspergillus californicus]
MTLKTTLSPTTRPILYAGLQLPCTPRKEARGLAASGVSSILDTPGRHPRRIRYYRVGDQRYKLTHWYNEDFGLEGMHPGGKEEE